MKHIHFIVNPISGTGADRVSKEMVEATFPESEGYKIHIFHSQHKQHATELTKTCIKINASIIVACGGDGTISEVASCLVGTNIPLGIIPAGSGNGLASNLNIPKNNQEALNLIKKGKNITIDVGSVNGNYFFSNSGMGFDAQVIKNYEASNERTITSYIKSSIKALQELALNDSYTISIDGKIINCQPFMVFVSNSNELGYNLSLTPKASLMDGKLDVLVISKISKVKVLLFGLLVLFKKHESLREVQLKSAEKITITSEKNELIEFQSDGEVKITKSNILKYHILKNALSVIC